MGRVTEKGATQTGFLKGTPVLCGTGDASASTMGAGEISEGDCYMYLGTTGWIAIALLLNVGIVHHWTVDTLIGSEDYEKFEAEIEKTPPGAKRPLKKSDY